MAEINPMNYITANRFYVEIDSTISAWFTECSGLGVTIDKETYLEGGVNDRQRILLKQSKFNDVTLKRGMTNDIVFWQWISQVLEGKPKQRLNISIILFNQAGARMQTWTMLGAIPTAWKAPGLQANSNTVAIEELTLSYEGLKVSNANNSQNQEILKGKGQQRDNLGYYS
ncbi:MAG: phage tail protein [Jaaginema sp. PMC 1079.18]|nr:phage tail protein [Jaaginema sp. PMC 1080.18]MEC4851548.1 phage tail protein [Jaaginema sp. PMC 1079.18]MEC4869135.1 phage tail protein [Jaaginema sp. PMC 1078.18]